MDRLHVFMSEKTTNEGFTVDYPYLKSTDRRVLPVSGAFGAVNREGNLVVHFYLEYPEIPISSTLEANPQGIAISEKLNIEHPLQCVREIVATLSIPVAVALPISNLMREQIKAFMDNQVQQKSQAKT